MMTGKGPPSSGQVIKVLMVPSGVWISSSVSNISGVPWLQLVMVVASVAGSIYGKGW